MMVAPPETSISLCARLTSCQPSKISWTSFLFHKEWFLCSQEIQEEWQVLILQLIDSVSFSIHKVTAYKLRELVSLDLNRLQTIKACLPQQKIKIKNDYLLRQSISEINFRRTIIWRGVVYLIHWSSSNLLKAIIHLTRQHRMPIQVATIKLTTYIKLCKTKLLPFLTKNLVLNLLRPQLINKKWVSKILMYVILKTWIVSLFKKTWMTVRAICSSLKLYHLEPSSNLVGLKLQLVK